MWGYPWNIKADGSCNADIENYEDRVQYQVNHRYRRVEGKENDIKTKYSDFYNAVYIDFQNKGRLSYLKSSYVQAALPYFYEFCEKKF